MYLPHSLAYKFVDYLWLSSRLFQLDLGGVVDEDGVLLGLAAGPALAAIAPELAEALLEEIGGVESLVGGEQQPERAAALQG